MVRTAPSRTGWITLALLTLVIVALAAPVFGVANSAETIFGFATLWLWAIVWGLFGIGVLLWAASRDAFSLGDSGLPAGGER